MSTFFKDIKHLCPVATEHAVKTEFRDANYISLTRRIGFDEHVAGDPMIERFAKDQLGRDFLVLVHEPGFEGEVFVHKRHLIDRAKQIAEENRSTTRFYVSNKR